MPSASKRLCAPAEETTFSSIMIDPMSLAPLCRAACAVALPTVSHEAWMLRILHNTRRLTAMMRRYSNGENRVVTPWRSNSVSVDRKIHGMNAMKPYFPSGQRACRSRIRSRWSTRWCGVSTWPYIIVAEVGRPRQCASCITSSHFSTDGLAGDMALRTTGSRISAPAPGSESSPAAIRRRRVSRVVRPLMRAMCATSGAPSACSRSVG